MCKNTLKVSAVVVLGIICTGVLVTNLWKYQKNFEKSLEGLSPESVMLERRLATNSPEEKVAFKLIWSIKTGDILMMLDHDGKEAVGIADQWDGRLRFLAPHYEMWWNTNPWTDSGQVLRFQQSFRKVIHMDNPAWCEHARWVYGGPKPKSTE